MTRRPFITLDNVTLRVGEAACFENTTWRIHEGEHWVVLGENGSGKSTLVGALGGRTLVVGGEVCYHFACSDPNESYPMDGTVPEDAIAYVSSEEQQAVAADAASYYQARWNSIEDAPAPNVRSKLRQMTGRGWKPIRETARAVGIENILDRHLAELSNGEVRKLLVARALLARPRLLILDDPYSGLDATSRARLAEIIDGLMTAAMNVIVVVQRAEEIPSRVTHALLVADRRIVAQGLRGQVMKHPAARRLLRKGPTRRAPVARPKPVAPARNPGKVIVALRNVRVTYGKTTILDGIDWEVRAGERWLLVGHNGAGKSTLLSLILGDNPQVYANDVSLFGRRRGAGESIWDVKRKIGWVSPELQWHYVGGAAILTVVGSGLHDSVGLYRRLSRCQRERALAWLERLDLHEAADTPMALLSAGEQRLVLLARALIKSPPLLVLDEPCQGLDRAHRDRFHTALAGILAEEGSHTLIYVTHHAEEAAPFTDHVLELAHGRVARNA